MTTHVHSEHAAAGILQRSDLKVIHAPVHAGTMNKDDIGPVPSDLAD
ncbi:hypothetical protein CULCOIPH002_12320 [Corynebacterium ulcerans]|uniref:Uncharacterized protein n=1 Tax=Corynebacterium ulcerans TaxID=65058 RepID=A0ABD0BEM6_CORUL|nr:hypothetical protein CULCOIPH001_08470 [Corynebacterium ulcerans]GJJ36320.1 hypothetical protein CULCOIPH002_12320 [Corynebacterium ulcerans]GJJ38489.1 hypothetical protein CULCOIPH003_11200 [Corynebacterium ulcerans]GJJ40363.1 hypothetical protein CULCOIPH004_07740 [Corynebacterium ulcerans]GJJ41822.1 hypothetical protein CULCOIPH005_00110 [Corynebacterium ulcerans]